MEFHLFLDQPRGCGGTGRRAGFRIQFLNRSAGSIPVSPIAGLTRPVHGLVAHSCKSFFVGRRKALVRFVIALRCLRIAGSGFPREFVFGHPGRRRAWARFCRAVNSQVSSLILEGGAVMAFRLPLRRLDVPQDGFRFGFTRKDQAAFHCHLVHDSIGFDGTSV